MARPISLDYVRILSEVRSSFDKSRFVNSSRSQMIRNGLQEASQIAQRIFDADPDCVNWNLDINRCIPDLDTVKDPDSIYGCRTFWNQKTVRFVFSTFHSYLHGREAVVKAGLTIEKDCPDRESGSWGRHAIVIKVTE